MHTTKDPKKMTRNHDHPGENHEVEDQGDLRATARSDQTEVEWVSFDSEKEPMEPAWGEMLDEADHPVSVEAQWLPPGGHDVCFGVAGRFGLEDRLMCDHLLRQRAPEKA